MTKLQETILAYREAKQNVANVPEGITPFTLEVRKAAKIATHKLMDLTVAECYEQLIACYTCWFPAKAGQSPEEQTQYQEQRETWCDHYLERMAEGMTFNDIVLAQAPQALLPAIRGVIKDLLNLHAFASMSPDLIGSLVKAIVQEQQS